MSMIVSINIQKKKEMLKLNHELSIYNLILFNCLGIFG
jgi:hypothetical protein